MAQPASKKGCGPRHASWLWPSIAVRRYGCVAEGFRDDGPEPAGWVVFVAETEGELARDFRGGKSVYVVDARGVTGRRYIVVLEMPGALDQADWRLRGQLWSTSAQAPQAVKARAKQHAEELTTRMRAEHGIILLKSQGGRSAGPHGPDQNQAPWGDASFISTCVAGAISVLAPVPANLGIYYVQDQGRMMLCGGYPRGHLGCAEQPFIRKYRHGWGFRKPSLR